MAANVRQQQGMPCFSPVGPCAHRAPRRVGRPRHGGAVSPLHAATGAGAAAAAAARPYVPWTQTQTRARVHGRERERGIGQGCGPVRACGAAPAPGATGADDAEEEHGAGVLWEDAGGKTDSPRAAPSVGCGTMAAEDLKQRDTNSDRGYDNDDGHDDDADDQLYDKLVSDDDYIVVDGKDVGKLIEELRAQGLDDLGSATEDFDATPKNARPWAPAPSDFFQAGSANGGARTAADEQYAAAGTDPGPVMEYFTAENMSFMPSWARSAYEEGTHHEIERGARRLGQERGARRLDAMVAADRRKSYSEREDMLRKNAASGHDDGTEDDEVVDLAAQADATEVDPDSLPNGSAVLDAVDNDWDGSGIFDCTVNDVAVDYNIPIELVIDIMLSMDVRPTINADDGIRDRLTMDEIEHMLLLITSFDAMDLADRYSDRTVQELAEDYGFALEEVISICNSEGIYLALGQATRLQLSREDRIVDMLRGVGTPGQDYPHLLEGLIDTSGDK